MAVVISLGIALAVVAFVVAPFFLLNRRPSEGAAQGGDAFDALGELMAEKETIYAAIQELDFDLESGKLSVEDHATLRQRYEIQAAGVLKHMDEMQQASQHPRSLSVHAGRNARDEKHP